MVIMEETIKDFVEYQLSVWPLAKKNYDALAMCQRRRFSIGDLNGAWQFNPARILSTGAEISKDKIAARKCFLCKENRPQEQLEMNLIPGWKILVNPYPIFPIHLTIPSVDHIPQETIPYEMITLADKLRGMTIFYNGSKAGASAPDHSHMQGVYTSELPLMNLIDKTHLSSMPGIYTSRQLGLDLPFEIRSALIHPGQQGLRNIKEMFRPSDGRLNLYVFIGSDSYLRIVRIDRSAHRPECYFAEGEDKLLVSPGCIDMAGIIITPRLEDFQKITLEDTEKIYRQTGLPAHESPGD